MDREKENSLRYGQKDEHGLTTRERVEEVWLEGMPLREAVATLGMKYATVWNHYQILNRRK